VHPATTSIYNAAGKSRRSKYHRPMKYMIAANNNGSKQFGSNPNEAIEPSSR